MSGTGWVKLHRELMEKAIWRQSTSDQKAILITILMMANHEERQWIWKGERYVCQPGQFVTSLPALAEAAGKDISIQNVRTAINKFKKYEFLTDESTGSGRLITVVNWAKYQSETDEVTDELTDDQQTANRPLTANKNIRTKESLKEKGILTDTQKEKAAKTELLMPAVREIVGYLNEKTGKNYSASSKNTVKLIKSLMKEGHTVDDFKIVIDNKVTEWSGIPKMEDYLRPNTLFASTHFEDYLNQKGGMKPPDNVISTDRFDNTRVEPRQRTGKFFNFPERHDAEHKSLVQQVINSQVVGGV